MVVKLLVQAPRNIQGAAQLSTVAIEFHHAHLPSWQCDSRAIGTLNLSCLKVLWLVPATRTSSSDNLHGPHNLLCVYFS